jgi:ankyrin repeat protein
MFPQNQDLASVHAKLVAIKIKTSALKKFVDSEQMNLLLQWVDECLAVQDKEDNLKIRALLLDLENFYKDMIRYYCQSLYQGKSLLMHAAAENHLELVKDVLAFAQNQINLTADDRSWEVNGRETLTGYPSQEHGYTALMYAITKGNVKVAELLIRAFECLHHTNSQGENALTLASLSPDQSMQNLLICAENIQAEEIFGRLLICSMKEVPPLVDLQQRLKIRKRLVVSHLLKAIAHERYREMLIKHALKVDANNLPTNPLSLYMWIDIDDTLCGHDEATLALLQTALKALQRNSFLQTPSSDYYQPMHVLSSPSKSAFFSYPLAYGPQTMSHPSREIKNGSALAFLTAGARL